MLKIINSQNLNYLAHIFLSGSHPQIQIGNFIGDFVKGNAFQNFPKKMAFGIQLHRKIDHFTDTNETVKELKSLIRPEFGRYSGIIADMYLDHFLAVHFRNYSKISLNHFAFHFYVYALLYYRHLPPRVKGFIFHFIFTNRLGKYATTEGLKQSLEIMTYHKVPALQPEKIIQFLETNRQTIENLCLTYFAEVILHFQHK